MALIQIFFMNKTGNKIFQFIYHRPQLTFVSKCIPMMKIK